MSQVLTEGFPTCTPTGNQERLPQEKRLPLASILLTALLKTGDTLAFGHPTTGVSLWQCANGRRHAPGFTLRYPSVRD
ncbi:hypothetical protein [Nostoc sp.]|uniref:hypothetical protein n=1 Tax=Nostoc sp. TaxID=1180 RepID=UPI002FF76C3E